jgi:formate-dependent nitrite reductase membrane component NrfD
MGVLAVIASISMLIYPGLLLAVIKRIPFWNTPALPLLFFSSGLCTGIACLLLIGLFLQVSGGQEMILSLHPLLIAEVILILVQIVVLGVYLEVSRHGGISALESVRSLKTLLFIGGVLLMGLIIPLGSLLGATIATDTSVLFLLVLIASFCLLIGGAFLRYSIIRAGVYLPLYDL